MLFPNYSATFDCEPLWFFSFQLQTWNYCKQWPPARCCL